MAIVLRLINEGLIQEKIANELDIESSHVAYYIKKAKRMGYVKSTIKDVVVILELTQAGKNFLDQYEKAHDSSSSSLHICRLENIRFKAEILQMPTIPVDWNKIQMHNWVQYSSKIDSVRILLNMGNSPSIELIPSPVDGEDPYDLLIILVYDCMNVIFTLYDRIGIRVGRLQLGSRGEWLVYDPIARAFCKSVGQVSYDGLAKVNASKPGRLGEFEFHDPRALADYLAMPRRIDKIERMLEKLLEYHNIQDQDQSRYEKGGVP
jgi:predicted transcriptional regulator